MWTDRFPSQTILTLPSICTMHNILCTALLPYFIFIQTHLCLLQILPAVLEWVHIAGLISRCMGPGPLQELSAPFHIVVEACVDQPMLIMKSRCCQSKSNLVVTTPELPPPLCLLNAILECQYYLVNEQDSLYMWQSRHDDLSSKSGLNVDAKLGLEMAKVIEMASMYEIPRSWTHLTINSIFSSMSIIWRYG